MHTVGFHDIEKSLLTNSVLLLEQRMFRIRPCYVASDHLEIMMRMVRNVRGLVRIVMKMGRNVNSANSRYVCAMSHRMT